MYYQNKKSVFFHNTQKIQTNIKYVKEHEKDIYSIWEEGFELVYLSFLGFVRTEQKPKNA